MPTLSVLCLVPGSNEPMSVDVGSGPSERSPVKSLQMMPCALVILGPVHAHTMSITTTPPRSPDPYGLSRVAPGVWFVQGDAPKRPANNSDPTVILLFGWMDAKTAHLAKFSAGYKMLFPYTDQIVIASYADIFLLPKFMLRRRLEPVAKLCESLGLTSVPEKPHRILVHALSNGGLVQLNYLSQILPKRRGDAKPIPSLVVLDSTPGGDDITSALHVFRSTIPNPVIRYLFFSLLLGVQIITFLLGRIPWNMHDILRKAVRQPQWLPWTGKQTQFLYIYSKADKSVPYHHIQSHTKVAESQGQDVTRLVFDSSEHVAHMRSDPERYWGAVKARWSNAVSAVA